MKLLTPAVTKELESQELSRELLRTQEMHKVADKTRKELANAQADFNEALAANRHKWATEEEVHSRRLEKMEKEVQILENRKVQALIPIGMYKKQADSLMQEAQVALKAALSRERDAEGVMEHLEDKLDAVGQKEQDLLRRDQRLTVKEKGVEDQRQQTINSVKELSKRLTEFQAIKAQAEKDIDARKTALVLWDRTLVAKEEKIKRTLKIIEDQKILLVDERGTLDRAWKELAAKKLSP